MFVKCELRFVATAVVISTLSLTWVFASASALDDSSTPLAALQVKADQAQPKDRCFLYAKLISQLTDLAGHQLNSGDSGQASETLQLVQQYAEKIHVGVADDHLPFQFGSASQKRFGFSSMETFARHSADPLGSLP
jgi:uncharacterized membrane protein